MSKFFLYYISIYLLHEDCHLGDYGKIYADKEYKQWDMGT